MFLISAVRCADEFARSRRRQLAVAVHGGNACVRLLRLATRPHAWLQPRLAHNQSPLKRKRRMRRYPAEFDGPHRRAGWRPARIVANQEAIARCASVSRPTTANSVEGGSCSPGSCGPGIPLGSIMCFPNSLWVWIRMHFAVTSLSAPFNRRSLSKSRAMPWHFCHTVAGMVRLSCRHGIRLHHPSSNTQLLYDAIIAAAICRHLSGT